MCIRDSLSAADLNPWLNHVLNRCNPNGLTWLCNVNVAVEVHISTQCNITNYEALRFYAQYADVVVLAQIGRAHV